ncbi:glycerol dehydratase reactivase beta/small subunit family protein [Tessaracoccus sp. Z1128]
MTKPTPPAIALHVHLDVPETALTGLLLGMEEEGVPAEVTRRDELNPLALAHAASLESRLGIGVGVALDYAVVTTEKLPEGRPYIAEWLGVSDRIVGSNAARIVKRIPLRATTREGNHHASLGAD